MTSVQHAHLRLRLHSRIGERELPRDGFPAENPVGILVVFEHRTTRTSTHSAIWLARQFLKRPAVKAWVAEEISGR